MPKSTRRKRGAQPGNTNALKYGFYTSRLPARDLDGLDQTAVTSLKDEIEVMRVFSRKVAELGSGVSDLDEAKDLLRVLSLSTSSINRLVRTNSRMPDPEDLSQSALLKQALEELEQEWPEFGAFCAEARGEPNPFAPIATDDPSAPPVSATPPAQALPSDPPVPALPSAPASAGPTSPPAGPVPQS